MITDRVNDTLEESKKKPKDSLVFKCSPHAGIPDLKKYQKLTDLNNRKTNHFMKKELVIKEIYSEPVHPYLRTMVAVISDAFKTAVKQVTNAIKQARKDKQGVFHLQCCDVFWIGRKPISHNHVINDVLRKMFDTRNVPKAFYNPDFMPPRSHVVNLSESAEVHSTVQLPLKELVDMDTRLSALFGESYQKKVTTDILQEHLNNQGEAQAMSEEDMEDNDWDSFSDDEDYQRAKGVVVDVPQVDEMLEFFNKQPEVGTLATTAVSVIGDDVSFQDIVTINRNSKLNDKELGEAKLLG